MASDTWQCSCVSGSHLSDRSPGLPKVPTLITLLWGTLWIATQQLSTFPLTQTQDGSFLLVNLRSDTILSLS